MMAPIDLPESVIDITHDSRQVLPGWAFACVVGEHADGHDFAQQAVDQGAAALIVQRRLPIDIHQVVVGDVRSEMGAIAAQIHGHPADSLKMAGVTGTNGKTTTTHILAAILSGAGLATEQLGTLSGARTTPESTDLQRTLARFVRDGVQAVVMEVSSHALALHRTNGTHFDVAVFTNLGRDHLDLHESMEAYFRAKASLFDPALSDHGVPNLDDPYGRLLLDASEIPMTGFSSSDAQAVEVGVDRLSFVWRGLSIMVPIGARFNVGNVLAALNAATVLGVDPVTAQAALRTCPPVPGRFELVSDPDRDPFSVVVDYAHTPDGLAELLGAARGLTSGGRVVIVFGCGGERDRAKRPLMGAAAARGADVVIITSDNPRHEDPDAIIAAAAQGAAQISGSEPIVESDRRAAIRQAFVLAERGDVVVVAGKGHETTQTIGDTAFPFDDRTVARELLEDLAP